jgi:hypothetical protein
MTPRSIKLKTRAEKFCAKLNDGLTAVAFVLAMAVFMAGTYRTIELLELTAQNGVPIDGFSGVTQAPQ